MTASEMREQFILQNPLYLMYDEMGVHRWTLSDEVHQIRIEEELKECESLITTSQILKDTHYDK